ncbi:hypothetical protein CQ020_05950 [Arthrobacter sp. MYb23]|uniref:S10 family serine carboxypeptidase-like protein n=1 Tax=unclassified Arthrobacter TaxID=235627 RepID=UPI000CFD53F6|nr:MULTISPECIES: hypothetical protein [unclassified Arthrobacter]PRB43036.1 hypothetical protein CQ038_08580 [Arthrobacter sp. MYb51]PRB97988.1 hypothetical protein CQ020_05950 [Arthrobacter sp. MYb23]
MHSRHTQCLGRTDLTVRTETQDALPVTLAVDLFEVSSATEILGDASVFSYVANSSETQASERPVLFVFNGGPGSSSMWLHLSGLAAFTAPVGDPADIAAPLNPRVQATENSVLDVADIVFIDPLGAGYGRRAEDTDLKETAGTSADSKSFAAIIRAWLLASKRLGCPVHLLGESYGTLRAAVLADLLRSEESIMVEGVGLLGQALNVMDTAQRPGNPLGYIANMELLAAAGWHHGLVDAPTVEDAVSAAAELGRGQYAHTLLNWHQTTDQQREELASKLEVVTGLAAAEWLRRKLRITKELFRDELLRSKGLRLGKYDARYATASWDADRGDLPLDPDTETFAPIFQACLEQVLTEIVGVETDREYLRHDEGLAGKWDWSLEPLDATGGPFARFDHVGSLIKWMHRGNTSRLLIGTGLYDTLTTIGAADILLATANLPIGRVLRRTYPGGHMMYTDPESARLLSQDVKSLVRGRVQHNIDGDGIDAVPPVDAEPWSVDTLH